MPQCSETIGAIAAALAKAQGELTNPEKSLSAIIRSTYPREEDRTFRYAPLSSGLDIIRKSLGRHEIATVQTTAIDADSQTIRLTTLLAHSSGEWISSDWPVCPISDTAAPRRMGAALTYARRYALFALVGISGDDDLDAPDLIPGAPPAKPNGDTNHQRVTTPAGVGKARPAPASKIILSDAEAKDLRERLQGEIATLRSAEDATKWAKDSLSLKNRLSQEDAKAIESAFGKRIDSLQEQIQDPTEERTASDASQAAVHEGRSTLPVTGSLRPRMPIEKTVRIRDKMHLRFVASQPCTICGKLPSDAHHVRFAQPRALGRKVSDEFTVPVCRAHHREIHSKGDEASWWRQTGLDPIMIARALWERRYPVGSRSAKAEA